MALTEDDDMIQAVPAFSSGPLVSSVTTSMYCTWLR